MSKIKNLKSGKSVTLESGIVVRKEDKIYVATLADGDYSFAYAPANRWWVVSTPQSDVLTYEVPLDEVVPMLVTRLEETAPVEATEQAEPVAEPSKELAIVEPAGEVELAAEVVEAEIVEDEDTEGDTPTQLDYDVDTKCGYNAQRITALATIANAAGATVDKHVQGGWNGSVTLTTLVPASQVDTLTDILQRFEAAVEPLAAAVSKRVSNQARSEGRHHSGPGCHARRGYIRGYADAVATKINPEAELEGDFGQNLKYDHDAYLEGLMAGESFQLA